MSERKYELQSISDLGHDHHHSFHVIKLHPLKSPIDKEYHRHDYYEIMFFEKGSGEHIIDFHSHKIASHSAHFVLPGQVHKLKRGKNSNGYALLFSEDLLLKSNNDNSSLLNLPFYDLKFANNLLLNKEDYKEIAELIEKLIKEENSKKDLAEMICGAYLTLLLLLLNRICRASGAFSENETSSGTFLLTGFKKLLEQNFMKNLKPGDYASSLNVSTGHLNDVIREAHGKTTGELIQERIILESKRLLFHTDLSVNEICYKLGFDDPAYFARLFKKHVDCTPKEYRVKSRK
ncbi:MAG: transcriptional regulator, AraC family [Bacteroidetes bacterium]|jgi:AraC-like DNA-binding protein|nr:transcriptional regulator, AraC family [Bacteroidota bacterium]